MRPANVTTKDGTPTCVTKKALMSPIARPVASPATIASSAGQPLFTLSTPVTPAARPLTAATDRSISPRSSTSATPTEIIPTAAICSVRFVRLTLDRKRSFATWKVAQTTASIATTRSDPRPLPISRLPASRGRRISVAVDAVTGTRYGRDDLVLRGLCGVE